MSSPRPTVSTWDRICGCDLYLVLVLLGCVFAWVLCGTPLASSRGFPNNTFLMTPGEHQSDLTNMLVITKNLDPYHDGTGSIYPPAANVVTYLFNLLPVPSDIFVFVGVPILLLAWYGWRWTAGMSLGRRIALITVGLIGTEPYLFCIDRGNLELWVVPCMFCFVEGFLSDDPKKREWGNLALAVAIALKLHPLVLGFLYVLKGRWYDLLRTGLYAVLVTLAAAACLKGGLHQGMSDFVESMGKFQANEDNLNYSHANTGLFYGLWLPQGATPGLWLDFLKLTYGKLAILICGATCFGLWKNRSGFAESYVALVALGCMLPTMSNDYRMVHLLPGVLLLIRSPNPLSPRRVILVLLLAALMIPKSQWNLHPDIAVLAIALSSILNPALLFVITWIAALGPGTPAPRAVPS